MSMFNDIELERKDNEDSCALTSRKIKEYASKINNGHLTFLGPREESKWYEGYAAEFGGKWDLRASQNGGNFQNSGYPVFQGVNWAVEISRKESRNHSLQLRIWQY